MGGVGVSGNVCFILCGWRRLPCTLVCRKSASLRQCVAACHGGGCCESAKVLAVLFFERYR